MNNEEIVERMAKAAHDARTDPRPLPEWEAMPESYQRRSRNMIRASLAALREMENTNG